MNYVVTFDYCMGSGETLIGDVETLSDARAIARERFQSSTSTRLVDGVAIIYRGHKPISRFDVKVDAYGFERVLETSLE